MHKTLQIVSYSIRKNDDRTKFFILDFQTTCSNFLNFNNDTQLKIQKTKLKQKILNFFLQQSSDDLIQATITLTRI